jgi:hypothetical protein
MTLLMIENLNIHRCLDFVYLNTVKVFVIVVEIVLVDIRNNYTVVVEVHRYWHHLGVDLDLL